MEAGTVSVRDRKERGKKDVDREAFPEHLLDEREEKRLEPDFIG